MSAILRSPRRRGKRFSAEIGEKKAAPLGTALSKRSPCETKRVTFVPIKKSLEIHPFPTPDLSGASIGKRIRYLRRKLRLTPADLAAASTISPNALLNLEREDAVPKDWVVGRILNAFGDKAREAFPGVKDVYDFLAPPTTFGGWLRNLRLRRGLKQADLAKSLGVSSVSVAHYESDLCRPRPEVQDKLKKFFKLNGELSSYFRRHE